MLFGLCVVNVRKKLKLMKFTTVKTLRYTSTSLEHLHRDINMWKPVCHNAAVVSEVINGIDGDAIDDDDDADDDDDEDDDDNYYLPHTIPCSPLYQILVSHISSGS